MRSLALFTILFGSLALGDLKQPGEHRLHLSEAEGNRHVRHRVEPACPENACKGCEEAKVTLKVVVGKNGAVKEVTVFRTSNRTLGEAAREAVRQWRYERYLLNDGPVEYETYTTIRSWKCEA
jgi:TonB family protein